MSTTWIKHGLTRGGVWFALVGVTVLLTVLFNFLGNLTCAVLAGMILGIAGRWQWNAIPISLVFPAVFLSLSHYAKLELPPGKVQLVALVCGVAFWGVYALAFALHFLEQKPEVPPGVATEAAVNVKPEFHLATLCGSWSCEESAPSGSTQSKTLRIEAGRFLLTVSERGRRRVIAQGDVKVDASRKDLSVVSFNAEPDSPDRR
jgi:hypothetical protein